MEHQQVIDTIQNELKGRYKQITFIWIDVVEASHAPSYIGIRNKWDVNITIATQPNTNVKKGSVINTLNATGLFIINRIPTGSKYKYFIENTPNVKIREYTKNA